MVQFGEDIPRQDLGSLDSMALEKGNDVLKDAGADPTKDQMNISIQAVRPNLSNGMLHCSGRLIFLSPETKVMSGR
jgi:hypothetical protein